MIAKESVSQDSDFMVKRYLIELLTYIIKMRNKTAERLNPVVSGHILNAE